MATAELKVRVKLEAESKGGSKVSHGAKGESEALHGF